MLHATLMLAAESGPSKVPFYILGGGLAAWAVVLGLVGLSRPAFPEGGAERAVIGVTVVLMLGAMVMAVVTA